MKWTDETERRAVAMSQDEWDAVIERAARAIYADERARSVTAIPPWERLNDEQRRFYRDTARVIARVVTIFAEER